MNITPIAARGRSDQPRSGPLRQSMLLGALLLTVTLLGFLVARKSRDPGLVQPPVSSASVAEVEVPTAAAKNVTPLAPAPRIALPASPATAAAVPAEPAAVQNGPHSPAELVAELEELTRQGGPISPEQADRFRAILAELVRQGAASVPAIRQFLQKNLESYYAEVAGGDQLRYSSLRASLFDALRQIGGPEAQTVMLETLQTTALPSELLQLSKDLELQAPGAFRDQILNAARESLAMAAANQLGSNTEVGPLFRMLQSYGDGNSIDDAAKADPAAFNNAVALANLPDGQGLPALLDMARTSAGSSQSIATEMIAQLAGENPDAFDALMQMAQDGKISNGTWMRLAPILGGDQYQVNNAPGQNGSADAAAPASQNYSIINGTSTPDDINQRIALIDEFLAVVPGDSAAASALRHERGILGGKLGN